MISRESWYREAWHLEANEREFASMLKRLQYMFSDGLYGSGEYDALVSDFVRLARRLGGDFEEKAGQWTTNSAELHEAITPPTVKSLPAIHGLMRRRWQEMPALPRSAAETLFKIINAENAGRGSRHYIRKNVARLLYKQLGRLPKNLDPETAGQVIDTPIEIETLELEYRYQLTPPKDPFVESGIQTVFSEYWGDGSWSTDTSYIGGVDLDEPLEMGVFLDDYTLVNQNLRVGDGVWVAEYQADVKIHFTVEDVEYSGRLEDIDEDGDIAYGFQRDLAQVMEREVKSLPRNTRGEFRLNEGWACPGLSGISVSPEDQDWFYHQYSGNHPAYQSDTPTQVYVIPARIWFVLQKKADANSEQLVRSEEGVERRKLKWLQEAALFPSKLEGYDFVFRSQNPQQLLRFEKHYRLLPLFEEQDRETLYRWALY